MVKNASNGARAASSEPASDLRSIERAMKRLRENIDQVDSVLVKLLNQRAQWALEIGELSLHAVDSLTRDGDAIE